MTPFIFNLINSNLNAGLLFQQSCYSNTDNLQYVLNIPI